MTINLKAPELRELKPRIMVCGVGGGGCNAVNNMISSGLSGVDFLVANTDAQALASSPAERVIQMGLQVTEGLGAGAQPEVGRAAAEEASEEIREQLQGAHMCFVTAGMGGGTGTGAAPVIAQIAREMGILTVGVVTKPFHFEGQRRLRIAEAGIGELQKCVDTLIVIPNQNLFRIATEKTTFADAFAMADQVLYSGVASVTDLMVKEGLINLDFADVRSIMRGMGKAMMGTGEATGERRANLAAEAAIANPLLDEVSMKGARGLLISITGGHDLTLYEVDEAASRIRQEVDEDANIILGATFDSSLEGVIRVSVVATGIDLAAITADDPTSMARMAEAAERMRAQMQAQQPKQQPAAMPVIETSAPVYAMPERERAPAPAYQPEAREPAPAPSHYYNEPAPPAPAQMTTNGVYLEPVPARPTYGEPRMQEPAPRMMAESAPAAYVPPPPEMPRTPRMPSIEDFPKPVQDQMRQHRGDAGSQHDPRRKSIFERLASFGASRQEDGMPPAQAQQPPMPPRAPAPQPSQTVSEYGKRPAAAPQQPHAQLDPHGRRAPQPRPMEEDHLEIPAFLRRQSNH
ncbi:MAG: cell division protein FtsZ [Methylocystis sp.]|uniref:cell division protein FtsZ n=1 Tax=Methylocystis sp. TaxID=1911079 RepID=UPI003DA1FE14